LRRRTNQNCERSDQASDEFGLKFHGNLSLATVVLPFHSPMLDDLKFKLVDPRAQWFRQFNARPQAEFARRTPRPIVAILRKTESNCIGAGRTPQFRPPPLQQRRKFSPEILDTCGVRSHQDCWINRVWLAIMPKFQGAAPGHRHFAIAPDST
jgi:hypothetical protein